MIGYARIYLVFAAVVQGYAAVFALAAPRSFYDDFPVPGADWVSSLAPYNEHLVRDYGAAFLALSVLAALAAYYGERRLVIVTLIVWLVSAVPHTAFHLAHTDAPGGFSGFMSLATLVLNVVVPIVLLFLIRKEPATP